MTLSSEILSRLSTPSHTDNRFPHPALQELLGQNICADSSQIVYTYYGMNDGIHMDPDTKRFTHFKERAN